MDVSNNQDMYIINSGNNNLESIKDIYLSCDRGKKERKVDTKYKREQRKKKYQKKRRLRWIITINII